MRSQVLRLIDDEEALAQAPAADVSQRRDHQFLAVDHPLDLERLLASGTELRLDYVQIVHQRLQVRAHLALLVARQETDVLVAQDHGRPGQDDLVVVPLLLQRGCQRNQGLARAGAAGQRHQGNAGIQTGIHGKLLLMVTRPDAIGALALDQENLALRGIVACADHLIVIILATDLEQGVGQRLPVRHFFPVHGRLGSVEQVLCDIVADPDLLYLTLRTFHALVVQFVRQVVLDHHPGGFGLHPEVDVLGHQRDETVRVVVPHPDGRGQDAMVRDIVPEKGLQIL